LVWRYICLISGHTHLSCSSERRVKNTSANKPFGTSSSILLRRKLKAYICPGHKGTGRRGCQRRKKGPPIAGGLCCGGMLN
jgi:hypothetical protein